MNRFQLFFVNKYLLNTKLMTAVVSEFCTPTEIRKLLDEDPTMLHQSNIAGDTPLHFAIKHGHSLENVVELLKQGARVSNVRFNTTPLHAAAGRACHHQYAMLKVLLEYVGEDINKRDFHYQTPLRILLSTMKGSFQEPSLYLLLTSGADVNALGSLHDSIIKTAILNSNITTNAIKMLLEFGANANDCVGYCLMNLPVAKLVMQYILIKRMTNTWLSVSPKKILDLRSFVWLDHYEELVEYRDQCITELTAMKFERINKDYTMFSYINERCSTEKVIKKDLKSSSTSTVLLKLDKYHFCKDLIIAALKEQCLINVVCSTHIYVWKHFVSDVSNQRYKVSLNSDTIQALATYLSRTDIINLTLAFKFKQIYFSEGCSKRFCFELNEFEKPLKCPKISDT